MSIVSRLLKIRTNEIWKVYKRYQHNVVEEVAQLSIAYFGTDKFSVYSLDKLVQYQQHNPGKIKSIDVITRSIKPTGRNLKNIQDVPIGKYAGENGVNVFRADSGDAIVNILNEKTFDLTIAVSYGKLIPEKFINSCKYGGLNVHPSLLPRYSGSSPIQYAIMNDDKVTGVTVQTLHPTKFDRGDILLQSEEIPILEEEDYCSLEAKLGQKGSDLLVKVIEQELFNKHLPIQSKYDYSLASKVSPKHREINWSNMTSRGIKRLEDALGPLHTYKYVDITKKKKKIKELQKVIIRNIEPLTINSYPLSKNGEFLHDIKSNKLIIKTVDGYISADKLKFQYCGEESPSEFIKHLKKRAGDTSHRFKEHSEIK